MATGTGAGSLLAVTGSATDHIESNYESLVKSHGAVAYWRLAENTGTIIVDESGNNNGTYVNSPTLGATSLVTNDSTPAVTFDGVADYGIIDISSIVFNTTDFGLSFSVNSADYSYLELCSIFQGPALKNNNDISIYTDVNNIAIWIADDLGVDNLVLTTSSAPLINNQTHHIHIGYNSGGIFVSVDGEDQPLSITSGTITTIDWPTIIESFDFIALGAYIKYTSTNTLSIGYSGTASTLDDISIYTTALTLSQRQAQTAFSIVNKWSGYITPVRGSATDHIQSVYEKRIKLNNPVAYWRLAEASGETTIVDEIGNTTGNYVGSPAQRYPSLVNGDTTTGVDFTGVKVYGLIDISNIVFSATNFAMSLMVSSSTYARFEVACIFRGPSSTSWDYMSIYTFSNNLKVSIKDGNGVRPFKMQTNTAPFIDGQKHHICFGYNASGVFIYVDGVNQPLTFTHGSSTTIDWVSLITSFDWITLGAFAYYTSSNTLHVGTGQSYIEDDAALFTSVLTPAEILQHYYIAFFDPKAEGTLSNITGSSSGLVIVPPISGTASGSLLAILGAVTTAQPTRPIVLILSGANDGLPNYEYLLKSFTATRRSPDLSRFTFQMPKRADDIDAYNLRPNGEMILYKDGVEIFRVDPQYINFNVGPTSETLSLVASRAYTNPAPKTIVLSGSDISSITQNSSSKRVFSVPSYIVVNPLDSILYNGETIQINNISMNSGTDGWKFTLIEV